jgi:monoamine oxidase
LRIRVLFGRLGRLRKIRETMPTFDRRTFLAASAAAAATPLIDRAAAADPEVIIVGAGAAGIAAARRLLAAGRRIVVLEAGARIGGRCITDQTIFGVPYDIGAHGIAVPELNPLMKLAPKMGLDVYPAPPGQKIRIGLRNARESEMEAFFAAVTRAYRAIDEAARGRNDMSCAQALPKDLADWRASVEFVLGPYGCAADLADISAIDFARSVERGTEAYCRQGFGTLLAKLADGIPVQTATPVMRIDLSRGVDVETPRGRLSARAVIVTASVGILGAGKIRFFPELPARQQEALGKLMIGAYERVTFQFNDNPLGLQGDEIVLEKAENARTAGLLANVGGTALCFVDMGGAFGRDLARAGEAAMTDFAREWLVGFYGSDIRKAIVKSHATQWQKAPWTLGSFTVARVGGQFARKVMMEPVRDRLFFAGEAMHESLWGTVGGAWESGERAAEAVLRKMGLLKDAEPAPKKAPPRKGTTKGSSL